MRLRMPRRDDRGESLLELVVAIVILGVCVVAIGAGIALSVKISSVHRGQALAQEWLHNDAELLQNSGYQACSAATTPDYSSPFGTLATPPDGGSWTVSQADIKFWNGNSFASGCPSGGDPGLQQVTLEMKSADGFVDETLVVIKRNAT